MNQHTERDHKTGKIREPPTPIVDNLEHRACGQRMEAGLIEGFAPVRQGMVHEDFHMPIFSLVRLLQADKTAEVLGRVGADEHRMLEFAEVDRVIAVGALRPEADLVFLAPFRDRVLLAIQQRQIGGHEIGAQRFAVLVAEPDVSRRELDPLLGVDADRFSLGHRHPVEANARGGQVFLRFPGPANVRIDHVTDHFDVERGAARLLPRYLPSERSRVSGFPHLGWD